MSTKNYSNETLSQLFNIWIVKYEGRKACLIESSNFGDIDLFNDEWNDIILPFITELNLVYQKDKFSVKGYPRILVSKKKVDYDTESELGKLLGFSYSGDDYGNFLIPRYTINIFLVTKEIKNLNLWTEVSLDEKTAEENVVYLQEKWSDIIEENPFPFLTNVKIKSSIEVDDGLIIRFEQLENDTYFLKNYEHYINDVENFYPEDDEDDLEETLGLMSIKPNKTEKKELQMRKAIWFESVQDELPNYLL